MLNQRVGVQLLVGPDWLVIEHGLRHGLGGVGKSEAESRAGHSLCRSSKHGIKQWKRGALEDDDLGTWMNDAVYLLGRWGPSRVRWLSLERGDNDDGERANGCR